MRIMCYIVSSMSIKIILHRKKLRDQVWGIFLKVRLIEVGFQSKHLDSESYNILYLFCLSQTCRKVKKKLAVHEHVHSLLKLFKKSLATADENT